MGGSVLPISIKALKKIDPSVVISSKIFWIKIDAIE